MKPTRNFQISRYPEMDIEEINALISQKKEHININEKVVPYDNDPDWKESLKRDKWWSRGYTGEIEERCKPVLQLKDRLLKIGGCEACLPVIEEDLENIMNYGQLWDNITRKSMVGRPSQCHSNSAELWYNNRNSYSKGFAVIICTGYALSTDGLWRQHSWLVQAKPRANFIIETTCPRIAYYGFGMTYQLAKEFEYYNS